MRWAYRVRQFAMRLSAHRGAVACQEVRGVLPGPAYALYVAMPAGDQLHALCVLHALRERGAISDELAQAAFLHDVGKVGGGLTLVHRALIVLLGWLGRGLVARLACPRPGSWRHPFYVHVHHAELGAQRCQAAGCAPLTVALVRYHDARAEDVPEMLRAALLRLCAADESC